MPRVVLVSKLSLTAEQRARADARVLDEKHRDDVGPFSFWNHPGYEPKYLAAFDAETGVFIGTVYGRITLPGYFDAAWWIDSERRESGYGCGLIDALAVYLKSCRVTELGPIVYRGTFEPASRKLAVRLKAHFK